MRLHLDSSIAGAENRAGAVTSGTVAGSGTQGSARPADGSSSRDSASVSGTAAALHQIEIERSNRIQLISNTFRNGAYNVPSGAVAGAIVTHASLRA